MKKKFTKDEFGFAQMREVAPGETVYVVCQSKKEVLALRSSIASFYNYNEPAGIERFTTTSKHTEDHKYTVSVTAVPA